MVDQITERDVLALWLARAYRDDRVTTEDGRKVIVDFAGFPSAHGGPDLVGARLTLGSERVTGDVELHLTTAGWHSHEHDADGAYQSVVLHVALWRGRGAAPARPYGRREIAEVVLESFLDDGVWPAVQKVRGLTRPEAASADLESLGLALLRRRVERYRLLLRSVGADELHYDETLRGLGFGGNQAGFAELARRVPLSSLGDGAPAMERALAKAAADIPWRLNGIRPANHPRRRLAGFARYLASTHGAPFAALRDAVERGSDLAARYRALGVSRALEIVFTIDQPMATAAGLSADDLDRGHPPIGWNRRTRLAAAASGVTRVSSVREQMGLLELYRRRMQG